MPEIETNDKLKVDTEMESIRSILNVILLNFVPSQQITQDSMTTNELQEIIEDHAGATNKKTICLCMEEAGYRSSFNYATSQLLWMMDMKEM